MDIIWFVVTVILVTASGALAPGPLFIATLTHGTRDGIRSGLLFAIAHTAVEFSLVMVFALGLNFFVDEPLVKQSIGVIGGIVLIGFGLYQIISAYANRSNYENKSPRSSRHLLFIGIAFSGLNPYFILWWFTVGAQLIIIALEFAGLLGVVFMYIAHVWMDYVWLCSVAWFAHKGVSFLTTGWYRIIIIVFGVILLYFGLSFIYSAI
jgi:threonine/homoserine/homoserine lactone efflux protein